MRTCIFRVLLFKWINSCSNDNEVDLDSTAQCMQKSWMYWHCTENSLSLSAAFQWLCLFIAHFKPTYYNKPLIFYTYSSRDNALCRKLSQCSPTGMSASGCLSLVQINNTLSTHVYAGTLFVRFIFLRS